MASNKKAASIRGKKGARAVPLEQQIRAVTKQHAELLKLQRETLQQLAKALERVSALEALQDESVDPATKTRRGLRLAFIARAFRLDYQAPREDDIERVRRAVFGDTGMRWLRRLRLIPQARRGA